MMKKEGKMVNSIPEMENMFGAFVHAVDDMDATCVSDFFTDDAWFKAPEIGIQCHSAKEIESALGDRFARIKSFGLPEWHIPHNLCAKSYSQTEGAIYCETHSYREDVKDNSFTLFSTRFDVKLKLADDVWRISWMHWYERQAFLPKHGERAILYIDGEKMKVLPGRCMPQDHLEIQNLLGKFCLWNRKNATDLFLDAADSELYLSGITCEQAVGKPAISNLLAKVDAMEQENRSCYLSVPFLGAPVVNVTGTKAEGWWMCHSYCLRSKLFGHEENEDCVRRIERWHGQFVRENEKWKILKLRTTVLAELQGDPIDQAAFGQIPVWEGNNLWPEIPREEGNCIREHTEDVYAAANLFPYWALRIARKEMQKAPEELFVSDPTRRELDINVRHNVGTDAMLPRLKEFDDNCRPHQITSHNASTPYYYVNEAGDKAEISWFDNAWTNMSAVFGNDNFPVEFMLNLGEYRFYLEKENGEWKVQKIWWRVIYRMPDLQMDPCEPCFCNSGTEEYWPLPFDTVTYDKAADPVS